MDQYARIIAVVSVLSRLAAARSYGGLNRHGDFHHAFEHPDPQRWHHGRPTWDSHESWQPRVHSYHHTQHNNRPDYFTLGGSDHLDKEYWQVHHPVDWGRRTDWEYPGSDHEDRYPAPAQNWNLQPWGRPPTRPSRPPIRPTTTVSPASQSQQQIQACMRSCPTTPEYNPVCGSNNITYSNPGRLECARFCGVDVTLQRRASCSVQTTTFAPIMPNQDDNNPIPERTTTSTLPPITPPRFTNKPPSSNPPPDRTSTFPNIDLSIFTERTTMSSTSDRITIAPDVLADIFPATENNGGDDVEIDIRTREAIW